MGQQLFKVYVIFIRPVIEYCCVIYHPMLTQGQSEELERLQKQVTKLCFGHDKSYKTICAEQNIKTLSERRVDYIDNFVFKTVNNPRYRDTWYPLRQDPVQGLRNRKPFKETVARTNRYFNSPLSYLRRRANFLASGERGENI